MYLNKKEEKIIGPLLRTMEAAVISERFELTWNSGTKILCSVGTTFESENGLELEDPNYEEYWGIAVIIVKIIVNGNELEGLKEGECIEINYHNAPSSYKKIE